MTGDRGSRHSSATRPEVPSAKQAERGPNSSQFAVAAGDRAPTFELASQSGALVPLDGLHGRPVVLVFGPAGAHDALATALASVNSELVATGVAAALIVAGDASLAARVGAPHGADVLVLADATGSVHRAYGVLDPLTGRPRIAAFVLDRASTVVRVFSQPEPERVVRLALDAVGRAG